MVKRYFGGIISASRISTSLNTATGFFGVIDAAQAVAVNNWPLPAKGDSYQEPSASRLLLINFNNNTLQAAGTFTITGGTALSLPTTGGVDNTGYATGWSLTDSTRYINISDFFTVASMSNVTVMAWYRGTQANISSSGYSPGVPVFGEVTNSVYWGLGMDDGKICVSSDGTVSKGTTSVNTNAWVHLAWSINSSRIVNAYVNGVREITNRQVNTGYPGIRYIGAGFNYAGAAAPTALDGIQIYSGVLSESQIANIYAAGIVS